MVRRLIVMLAAAALTVLGPVAPTQAAASTSVSGWTATSASAPTGYTLANAVTVRTGTATVARTVQVQRRAGTSTSWTTVTTAKTSTTGALTARLTVPATGTWYFRLYVPATTTAAAAATSQRKVTGITGTATGVTGWDTTTATGATGYTITDAVAVKTGTGYPTRTVQLQRRASTTTTWTTISAGPTKTAGAFTATYAVPAPGTWYFRLYIPPTSTAAGSGTVARKVSGIRGLATIVTGWTTTSDTAPAGYIYTAPAKVQTGASYITRRTVIIQRRPATATSWTTIATGTTDQYGRYPASYDAPTIGTWYVRLLVPATTNAAAYTAAQRQITAFNGTPSTVTGWPTATETTEAEQTLTASARVQTGAGYTSRPVKVQRRLASTTSWITVANGTTNSLGGYSGSYYIPSAGTWHIRLLAPATLTAAGATSAERQVTATPVMTWGARQVIEPRTGGLQSISCPASDFCAAVDGNSAAFTFDGRSWTKRPSGVEGAALTAVSCTSKTFCAAVTGGQVITFNGSTWSQPRAVGSYLSSISCPSTNMCIATGGTNGAVYTYNGSSWSGREQIPGLGSLWSVTCPTALFCMVIDNAGKTATLNGLTYTWSPSAATTLQPYGGPFALSCASATLCASVSVNGSATTYNGTTWTTPTTITDRLRSVSCSTASLCVAVNGSNQTWTYNAGTWSPTTTPEGFSVVSCHGTSFCAAIGDDAVSTFDGTVWSAPTTIDPISGMWHDISCPTEAFCAAVTSRGEVFTYNGTSWTKTQTITQPYTELRSVTCTSSTFCLAVDHNGGSYTFDGAVWTTLPGVNLLYSVTCASPTFCLGLDAYGRLGAFDGETWSIGDRLFSRGASSISCPAATYCMATDSESGSYITFNGVEWTAPTSFYPAGRLRGISCASPTLCVALGANGAASYNGTSWSTPVYDGTQNLYEVSCTAPSFCAATGTGAQTFNGTAWSKLKPLEGNYGGPVSCATRTFCAVADTYGGVIFGRRA